MSKRNFISGLALGLLVGCVVGFFFANSLNRNANQPTPLTVDPGELTSSQSALHSDGSLPQVQAVIDKARSEPENFDAQIRAAEMYYQIRRFDEAIELLERANRLNPEDYGTLVSIGNAHFEANRFEESEKWYSAALEKNADDSNVRTDLGLTFLLRQPPDYDRAIREFGRSLEKKPGHPQTLQNLTAAYIKKGDAAKARNTLAKFESVDATNPVIARLREDIQKLESK